MEPLGHLPGFRNPAGQQKCADVGVGEDHEGARRDGVSGLRGGHGFGDAAGIAAGDSDRPGRGTRGNEVGQLLQGEGFR